MTVGIDGKIEIGMTRPQTTMAEMVEAVRPDRGTTAEEMAVAMAAGPLILQVMLLLLSLCLPQPMLGKTPLPLVLLSVGLLRVLW